MVGQEQMWQHCSDYYNFLEREGLQDNSENYDKFVEEEEEQSETRSQFEQ